MERTDDSSFSLLTKCCHDIDLIQWLLEPSYSEDRTEDARVCMPDRISSFGSLCHFRKSQKPKAAGDAQRCMDCSLVDSCAYSAKKIYLDDFKQTGHLKGFRKSLTDQQDIESIIDAPGKTNYGRCVYEMDNDVCDNQVVMLQYHTSDGIVNVNFNMIAFSKDQCIRKTTIYGSEGQIEADGYRKVSVYNFSSGQSDVHEVDENTADADLSHANGDRGLASQIIAAVSAVKSQAMSVADAQRRFIGCTVDDIYRSHSIVFLAEDARLENTIICQ